MFLGGTAILVACGCVKGSVSLGAMLDFSYSAI
jgi:hypothetical protein